MVEGREGNFEEHNNRSFVGANEVFKGVKEINPRGSHRRSISFDWTRLSDPPSGLALSRSVSAPRKRQMCQNWDCK